MSCRPPATHLAEARWTSFSSRSAMACAVPTSRCRWPTPSASRSSRSSRSLRRRIRRSTSATAPSANKSVRVSSDFFERLRKRAVEIHVVDHLRSRLEKGDKLRVKLGLDPTAPDLHVGHLVVLDALRAFQDDGHVVVLIVGDFTALIGDPSGRSETRPVLSREQIDANAKTYFDQIYLVLDRDRLEVRRNAEWLGTMAAADVLRLMGKGTLHAGAR